MKRSKPKLTPLKRYVEALQVHFPQYKVTGKTLRDIPWKAQIFVWTKSGVERSLGGFTLESSDGDRPRGKTDKWLDEWGSRWAKKLKPQLQKEFDRFDLKTLKAKGK